MSSRRSDRSATPSNCERQLAGERNWRMVQRHCRSVKRGAEQVYARAADPVQRPLIPSRSEVKVVRVQAAKERELVSGRRLDFGYRRRDA